ncbi:hypothetical protein EDB81DRAFT_631359, partial [Dactylonectria macrodidyma]
MPRLPLAEKLPLVVRKDIRDNWESKREGHEKAISDILGEPWTININPNAIWPYAEDNSWAKISTGKMIQRYVAGAEDQLKSFIGYFGEEGKVEINDICSAHTITLAFDEAKKVSYCGCEVSAAGELVLLFSEGNLGTNIDDALSRSNLAKALNEALVSGDSAKPMSDATCTGINKEYAAENAPGQEKLNKILATEIPLDPNFEAVFEKLKVGANSPDGWE